MQKMRELESKSWEKLTVDWKIEQLSEGITQTRAVNLLVETQQKKH